MWPRSAKAALSHKHKHPSWAAFYSERNLQLSGAEAFLAMEFRQRAGSEPT